MAWKRARHTLTSPQNRRRRKVPRVTQTTKLLGGKLPVFNLQKVGTSRWIFTAGRGPRKALPLPPKYQTSSLSSGLSLFAMRTSVQDDASHWSRKVYANELSWETSAIRSTNSERKSRRKQKKDSDRMERSIYSVSVKALPFCCRCACRILFFT